jgi:hypothetical protein
LFTILLLKVSTVAVAFDLAYVFVPDVEGVPIVHAFFGVPAVVCVHAVAGVLAVACVLLQAFLMPLQASLLLKACVCIRGGQTP